MSTNLHTRTPRKEDLIWEDPIVAEVRAIREKILAEYDYDLRRVFEAAREQQAASGKRVIPVPSQPTDAASS
jgi:hypothetical protein